MIARLVFVVCLAAFVGTACAPASTPTPIATPVPSPTVVVPTPTGVLSSLVSNSGAPAAVPACKDAQALDEPILFSWAGIEAVVESVPEENWTYYRCGQSPDAVSAFYQHWLAEPQYRWVQQGWEKRGDMTMGVFFSNTGNPADPNRWLYLWFLPDASQTQSSYLVAAWSLAAKSC